MKHKNERNSVELALPKNLHKRAPIAITPSEWIERYLCKVSGVRSARRPARGWLDEAALAPARPARRRAVVLSFGSAAGPQ